MISKILVGRKTSEVVENADESGFGEGQLTASNSRPDEIFGTDRFVVETDRHLPLISYRKSAVAESDSFKRHH